MKAIIYNKKVLPYKLVPTEVEKPVPGDNEVLIKMFAASVNAADYRSMKMGLIPKKKIFGADVAGRIEIAGKNIQQFKPGDEVMGDLASYGFGGFAAYALAPERLLAIKPNKLSFEEAAALPLAAVTALQGLRDKGSIRKGHEVLVLGSAGGVGSYAVQLAKYFGATVTGVCSTANVELTRSLGAAEVIDYTKENFTRGSKKYDIILAVNGNYSLFACRSKLKPGGRYVMVGGHMAQIFKSLVFGWSLSFSSRKIRSLAAKPNQKDLEFIAGLANDGVIKPVIDRSFPFDETPEAFHYVSQGHARGKVVIKIG